MLSKRGVMSPGDADLCACFLSESRALRGLSLPRVNLYASTLSRCRRFLNTDFDQATVDDLYRAVAVLRAPGAKDGKKSYKKNTLQSTITILRIFYHWLIDNGHSSIPADRIDRIIPDRKDKMTKRAADILTPEEITALMDACRSSRGRALLMTLYEGGFRIGEVGRPLTDDAAAEVRQMIREEMGRE